MRYFLQAVVMLSDLLLTAAIIYVLYATRNIGGLIIAGLAIWAWSKNGGMFYAWRPSVIKQFMANAKKIGL